MEREFKSDVLNDLKNLVNENEQLTKRLNEGTVTYSLRRPATAWYFTGDFKDIVAIGKNIPDEVEHYLSQHVKLIGRIEDELEKLSKERANIDETVKKSTDYMALESTCARLEKSIKGLESDLKESIKTNLEHLSLFKKLQTELLDISVWNVRSTSFKLISEINLILEKNIKK